MSDVRVYSCLAENSFYLYFTEKSRDRIAINQEWKAAYLIDTT